MDLRTFGVGIKVSSRGLSTADEIIQDHIYFSKTSPQHLVYFSTNLYIKSIILNELDKLLLFTAEGGLYLGEIVGYHYSGPKVDMPNDISDLSPPKYQEPKRLWFLVENLREVDSDQLASFVDKNNGTAIVNLIASYEGSRANRFYFKGGTL